MTMPTLEVLALCPLRMLLIAISAHRRLYQGRLPKRIVLHPLVLREALATMHKRPELRGAGQYARDGLLYLDSVPLVPDPRCEAPYLVAWTGEHEDL